MKEQEGTKKAVSDGARAPGGPEVLDGAEAWAAAGALKAAWDSDAAKDRTAAERPGPPSGGARQDVRKRCHKCLLREMDEAAYMEKLHRYIVLLDSDVKAGEALYGGRLEICRACDYLEAGTCLACGCYVELRAAVKKNRCPYKKW